MAKTRFSNHTFGLEGISLEAFKPLDRYSSTSTRVLLASTRVLRIVPCGFWLDRILNFLLSRRPPVTSPQDASRPPTQACAALYGCPAPHRHRATAQGRTAGLWRASRAHARAHTRTRADGPRLGAAAHPTPDARERWRRRHEGRGRALRASGVWRVSACIVLVGHSGGKGHSSRGVLYFAIALDCHWHCCGARARVAQLRH